MKNIVLAIATLCAINTATAQFKVVEYFEDAYLQQAPQELVAQVEKIAQAVGFDKEYQVVVPKKPGLQINPWNKLVAAGINPQNKLPFIIINPEWFSTLNAEQQEFLLARNIVFAVEGTTSTAMKLFPFIWMAVIFSLMILAFVLLRRTRFVSKPLWMRVIAIYAVFAIANLTFLTSLYNKMYTAISRKHDAHVTHVALEKTGQDKQVAISTFQAMNDFVKKELSGGDTFWKPYETTFGDLVERLK